MGYVAGETILDDEYNNFVNSSSSPYGINHIIGTGDGAYGLGQTTVATVTAGDSITAAQWNSLFTAMDNLANHTNDSITSTAQRSAGDTVTAIAALTTDLATLAASVAGGSVNASGLTESGADVTSSSTGVFDTSHVVETSYTFDGGDEARWFFNAGGKLRIKLTNTATNSTAKDTSMSALATALGNFDMGATLSTRSGSGETVTTNGLTLGYYDLTTSYQTLLELTEDSGTYSGNIAIKIEAKTSTAHADARNNNGEVVTIKCSALQNDGVTADYTSNNVGGINVEEEAVGPTNWAFHTMDPNTSEGLSTVYTNISVASVSNTTNNAD
jgi:hypothetical protein